MSKCNIFIDEIKMYIHVKVKTEAKNENVTKLSADHFEISVREKAVRNMANKKVIELLSKQFPHQTIRIINGHHSPSKLIAVGE